MKGYIRVMLGAGSAHAQECFAGGFVGADFDIVEDLSERLPDDWRTFNREFIPIYLASHPDKTKIGAGLACGALWTISKGMKVGDVVLSPDGTGRYHVAEVTGDYYHQPEGPLPHRRPVTWLPQVIDRADMSEALRNSTGSIGTVSNITSYEAEIERLLGGAPGPAIVSTDETIEDPSEFALEKHLEDFLVQNWSQTDLATEFDIYQEDGARVGQQFPTDTGPIDILAISKDKHRLLVIELKKGRASDAVVGQILRYMGFVQDVLAEPGQLVTGAIIAHVDDQRIRRALAVVPAVAFYRYQVSFKLLKS